jgi:hypothetical protein
MKIYEHNIETGEAVERNMTASEIKQWEADQDKTEADRLEAIVKAEAKAALLTKLGITEDEAKLLLL